ncbi:hypothetical protein BGZ52_007707, partial [Haplosporangium bisporale]
MDSLLHIAGAWGAFGTMATMLLCFSVFFTLYYSDPRDREPFAMVITILALTLCLTTVALFPIDIFLVSRIMNSATGLLAYGLIASFIFFWIPLSYFYFEELEEDQGVGSRLWAALKYTFFFIIIAGILLVTGLFMKPNDHEDVDLDWLRKILANLDGSGALAFVAGVMALTGMGVLVFYT